MSINDVYLRKMYIRVYQEKTLRNKNGLNFWKKLDSTQNILLVADSTNRKIEDELKKVSLFIDFET